MSIRCLMLFISQFNNVDSYTNEDLDKILNLVICF
jgi:hypothetical protein